MNLLVLHGPNLNLIGSISARNGENITLSKIDSKLKRAARESNTNLKIMQTHKVFNAINFVQRNRNWADGLLFSPSSNKGCTTNVFKRFSLSKYNFSNLKSSKI